MTTIGDIVSSAIHDLGIVDPLSPIDSVDAATGLKKLNSMMRALEASGINLFWPDGIALTDAFPLGERHVQGVEAMLTVRLAAIPAYAQDAGRETKSMAITGKQLLYADYVVQEPMQSPSGLRDFSANRRG